MDTLRIEYYTEDGIEKFKVMRGENLVAGPFRQTYGTIVYLTRIPESRVANRLVDAIHFSKEKECDSYSIIL